MFDNIKNYKPVKDLYECISYDKGWRIKQNEDDSFEDVPNELFNNVMQAIRNIVGKDKHKFGYIPAKAIMNELVRVSEEFRQEQDEWLKYNPNLRNTGGYTQRYYNVLHVMNHLGLIAYYKRGNIEISDKILTEKERKVYKKHKMPTLHKWGLSLWIS